MKANKTRVPNVEDKIEDAYGNIIEYMYFDINWRENHVTKLDNLKRNIF